MFSPVQVFLTLLLVAVCTSSLGTHGGPEPFDEGDPGIQECLKENNLTSEELRRPHHQRRFPGSPHDGPDGDALGGPPGGHRGWRHGPPSFNLPGSSPDGADGDALGGPPDGHRGWRHGPPSFNFPGSSPDGADGDALGGPPDGHRGWRQGPPPPQFSGGPHEELGGNGGEGWSGGNRGWRRGPPEAASPKILCFLKCMAEKEGFLKDDGTLDAKTFRETVGSRMPPEHLEEVVECIGAIDEIAECEDMEQLLACHHPRGRMSRREMPRHSEGGLIEPDGPKFQACLQELNLDVEKLKAFRDAEEKPEEALCFLKCLAERSGVLKPDGTLDHDVFDKRRDEKLKGRVPDDKLNEMSDCVKKIDKIATCQDVKKVAECLKPLKAEL